MYVCVCIKITLPFIIFHELAISCYMWYVRKYLTHIPDNFLVRITVEENIPMFFSTSFYYLVKELSEWIHAPSRAAWVGWMSQTASCWMLPGTRALKLFIFYFPRDTFSYFTQDILHKEHGLDRSRLMWGITVSNFFFNLSCSQKLSSEALLLMSSLLWFIQCTFPCVAIFYSALP